MINLDHTLAIQIVNFLLLILILHFILYKPIIKIIEKRTTMITESGDEVNSLNKSVDEKIEAYEEKLRQARMEAVKQRDALKEGGADRAKQIIEVARNEISETIAGLKAKMEKERDDARTILLEGTRGIAREISEKVLGRGV
ncbi:MAG: ATP synthase F0 subunit B [Deltaproteobacteria bacterium]|nr:ATP synthase F0 subunit B [Deltaproteobacteria bacterium]